MEKQIRKERTDSDGRQKSRNQEISWSQEHTPLKKKIGNRWNQEKQKKGIMIQEPTNSGGRSGRMHLGEAPSAREQVDSDHPLAWGSEGHQLIVCLIRGLRVSFWL